MNPSAASISWQPTVDHEKMILIVVTPDDKTYSREFASGSTPTFRLQDLPGKYGDGVYTFELRAVPHVSAEVKRQLAEARGKNDDAAVEHIQSANGLDRTLAQSGVLTVINGSFVNSDAEETHGPSTKAAVSSTRRDEADERDRAGNAVTASRNTPIAAPMTLVTAQDEVIQGSLCVGLDCTSTESFGFDTIRLKENNTRVKFDDTSTSAGFPNTDWQLTANDSGSGGANKFSIEDITNTKVPFTITAAAPTNSLFVASSGKVGLGNSSPGLNLHITATDTPAIRQEQTNGGGFTAQTWDIGGNEANWFVRDLTGGSRLPFRIRPGAPTSSIDIAATGYVGIGTASPSVKVHAFENADVNSFIEVQNPSATSNANATLRAASDTGIFDIKVHSSTRTISRFGVTLGGWSELLSFSPNGAILGTSSATPLILGTNSTNRLQIDGTTGAVTVSGNFTVTGVKNFAMPDPTQPSTAIYYASLEGPEAGTYFRGTAKTVKGEAVIELPGYFSHITEKERMTVQLTPVGAPGQIYVASRTPERIVIKAAAGADDVEFDYFVQGVRKGYLDYKVERENHLPTSNQ